MKQQVWLSNSNDYRKVYAAISPLNLMLGFAGLYQTLNPNT